MCRNFEYPTDAVVTGSQVTYRCHNWSQSRFVPNCYSMPVSLSTINAVGKGRVVRVGGSTGFSHLVSIGHFHSSAGAHLTGANAETGLPPIGWQVDIEPDDLTSKSAFMFLMYIPDGAVVPGHSVRELTFFCVIRQPVSMRIAEIKLHTHRLGQEFVLWKVTPEGHEQILKIDHNSNHNGQESDISKQDLRINPGDRIWFKCTMNNTSPHPVAIG